MFNSKKVHRGTDPTVQGLSITDDSDLNKIKLKTQQTINTYSYERNDEKSSDEVNFESKDYTLFIIFFLSNNQKI